MLLDSVLTVGAIRLKYAAHLVSSNLELDYS